MSKQEIAAAYEALTQFLYQAPIGLVQMTPDGAITMMNPAAASLLVPLAPNDSLTNLFDILAELVPDLRSLVTAYGEPTGLILDGHRFSPAHRPDVHGERQTFALTLSKLNPDTIMSSVSDVTAEVEREKMRLTTILDRVARVDSLTSMPSRAVMLELIAKVLAADVDRAGLSAVLLIDCDRFKNINDAYGRGACDQLLRLMANRLTAGIRPVDTVSTALGCAQTAARLGGDEFVVLLEGLVTADDAVTVAQRLVDVLSRAYAITDQYLSPTVSIGVSVLPYAELAEGLDADQVLQDASIAMQDAKRKGGNRCSVFEPAMRERVARRVMVEHELRAALQSDQLSVFYQPIIRLEDDSVAGFEALVRWWHPGRGMILPVEFIPIAEESGLIVALGKFVLGESCRQFMAWQDALGPAAPGFISVNLSAAQLSDPYLVAHVDSVLVRTGMDPAQLLLEITESVAAGEDLLPRLRQLKALGISLALDDFGTGHSSLWNLHRMPIDIIKIDRSFVAEAEDSPRVRALIDGTVNVARSLDMGIVAEGVETARQLAVMAKLGCAKVQGYYFSRPLAAGKATDWLIERHREHHVVD